MKTLLVIILLTMGGCASSLRCGTDGDSSYVDLINVRDIPSSGRYYAELCGFSYEENDDEGTRETGVE